MTVELGTFYNYITNNNSDNITRFKTTFSDKIHRLPDKVVSSKYLIKHLGISVLQGTFTDDVDRRQGTFTEGTLSMSCIEFKIFQNVYLDYFRFKFDKTYT
jgi:hypothetical protein